ncbi:MAG TPA: STAS domain-containing protein [Gemmataceae bacterium]|jgi:anti-anti-sigma factor
MPPFVGSLLQSAVDQGVLVLTVTQSRLQGEEVAEALRDELHAAVARTGVNLVVIDLRHARYLSSVAFWPLLSLRRQLLDAGGRLMICGLCEDVEDVFATTKMISTGGAVDAPFEVAPDADDAVARLVEDARPA